MEFSYNISFEIAAIIMLLLLLVYVCSNFDFKLQLNIVFTHLILLMLLTNIFDVVTAITIQHYRMIDSLLNTILNTIYLFFAVITAYYWYNFVVVALDGGTVFRKLTRVNRIMLVLFMVLLLVNLFTGICFSFDLEDGYIYGNLHFLLYFLPVYYVLTSGWVLWVCRKEKNRHFGIAFWILPVVAILGPLLQFFCLQGVLLSAFTPSLGIIMLPYFMESPQYRKLQLQMEELKAEKEDILLSSENSRKANQNKTQFLAKISHEIRTPINSLLGYNELILKETTEPAVKEYAMNVQTAGRTLISLVNDISDFTNIDGGNLKIEKRPYSVLSFVQDVIAYAQFNTEKNNLEFHYNIDENIPEQLCGDMLHLIQIFNNLISNSVKFTQEGSVELYMTWTAKGDNLGILSAVIKDTGIGMKEEERIRLQQHLEQSDVRHIYNIEKTELGLVIVTKLLDMMGSKLEIDSEYGVGTTISFQIEQEVWSKESIGPIEKMNYVNLVAKTDEEVDFFAPKARILAVDDNRMNLDLICKVLQDNGMTIDTAQNGEEALEYMRMNSYHLILLDHLMPVLDGMETLKIMQEENLCEDVPVIVITANVLAGDRDGYIAAGFTDYIGKPVKGNELKNMILKYLPDCVLEGR